MAAPPPANMNICDPKCKCLSGPYANQVYSCDDPCGTGNKEDFNPLDCSCPDLYYPEPAYFYRATMYRCYTTTVYDGWTAYLPSTEAQNYAPVSAELAPYAVNECIVGDRIVSALTVVYTFADGTTRRTGGGTSFIRDHNQLWVLHEWGWGDANADYFYPLTITKTDNP